MNFNTLKPRPRQEADAHAADDAQHAKPSYRFTGANPSALSHLSDSASWVGWDYRRKNGRWTKPPLNPHTGALAKVNEPQTWSSFHHAVAGMERYGYAGVGLVLTTDLDIIGIDLDQCISDSDSFSDLAAAIITLGETYAEVSPSGAGIRLFARGATEAALKDDALGIEIYSRDRFLTVTGNHIPDTPHEIRAAPRTLARLMAAVVRKRGAKGQPKANGRHHPVGSGDFFGNVNAAALARLDDWVPTLHPTARKQPNGAWRITSNELGRDLEEDLAYHPQGIRDHGEEHGLSPIDAVQRYGDAADAKAAAMWLCRTLGVEPSGLGWGPTATGATTPPKNPRAQEKSAPQDDPSHWYVVPWPEEVSGAGLLDAIVVVVRRYMVLPEHAAEAIALWVLHAWTIDAWEISPILIVVSPTKQCGKSTLMTLIYWITPRSELVSNATASPIFRLIEESQPHIPTFLLDEGDSYLKPDKEDLRGILNSGWMRAGARVIRTDGDGSKRRARRFSTWAPKVIATIKAVADTLMDRAVVITLRRKAKSETVERFRMRDTAEFATLRQQARRWADDHAGALRDADPDVPSALQNRAADNWRALIAVADAAGGDWPERARAAAVALTGAKSDDDKGVMLLRDIRRVFDDCGQDWLGAVTLVERLIELPEGPWAEWRRGEKPITSRGVATILRDFEIKSDDDHRPRRYWRADLAAAWASYLSISEDSSGASG